MHCQYYSKIKIKFYLKTFYQSEIKKNTKVNYFRTIQETHWQFCNQTGAHDFYRERGTVQYILHMSAALWATGGHKRRESSKAWHSRHAHKGRDGTWWLIIHHNKYKCMRQYCKVDKCKYESGIYAFKRDTNHKALPYTPQRNLFSFQKNENVIYFNI